MIGGRTGSALEGALSQGVVRTPSGLVRGTEEEGVWAFKGIPYARAPVGALRWRAPEPPPMRVGILEASRWGPIAPQGAPVPGMSIAGDPTAWDEDCLNLNVWTPALDDGRRPVMLWLHGGGFTSGSGAGLLYRGHRLASRGVVVVTLNYRLGALGFLAHPLLAPSEGSPFGNWGLLDQIAALRWVRACVDEFGGDPDNVTVFGESAGGMSVASLLGAELGEVLFHRAVVQSGPPATSSVVWAARQARRLGELIGAGEISRQSLEEVAPEELVSAAQRMARDERPPNELPLPLLPVVDGSLLKQAPERSVADGSPPSVVPLLIGTTRDECTFFTYADQRTADLDMAGVVRFTAEITGPGAAGDIVESYRVARSSRGESTEPRGLWSSIATDLTFRLPSLALALDHARHGPTFVYLFDWESPFLGGILGSCHALEIPFVFGTENEDPISVFTGGGHEAARLSKTIGDAWVAFARSADPSCDALGEWPEYDDRRATMVLGRTPALETDPRGEERSVWEDCGVPVAGGHNHL